MRWGWWSARCPKKQRTRPESEQYPRRRVSDPSVPRRMRTREGAEEATEEERRQTECEGGYKDWGTREIEWRGWMSSRWMGIQTYIFLFSSSRLKEARAESYGSSCKTMDEVEEDEALETEKAQACGWPASNHVVVVLTATQAAWERAYEADRSWEGLEEDEFGRLREADPTADQRVKRRVLKPSQVTLVDQKLTQLRRQRFLDNAATARIRRGMIRYCLVVLDLSVSVNEVRAVAAHGQGSRAKRGRRTSAPLAWACCRSCCLCSCALSLPRTR